MSSAPTLRTALLDQATRHYDPVIEPDLAKLYAARQARLMALAQDNPAAEYLHFVADVVGLQRALLDKVVAGAPLPLAAAQEGQWLTLLQELETRLAQSAPQSLRPHLTTLSALSGAEREAAGIALAEGRFSAVDPALAPVFWAALSEQVAVSVRAQPVPAKASASAHICPVCGSLPAASVLLPNGLRYLHCALCESQWHVVHAACSNCDSTGTVDYLSLDTTEAVTRAECCDHCHGYLKIVSQARDVTAEPVADDLATLPLDEAVALEGYLRTGLNPWALPQDDARSVTRVPG